MISKNPLVPLRLGKRIKGYRDEPLRKIMSLRGDVSLFVQLIEKELNFL